MVVQEINHRSPIICPPFPLDLAEELLATYGSPLYVYEGDRLRQTVRDITQAISYPRTQFHFASVTNGNLSLLRIFQEEGWGLHANTPGDVYLGLQTGFHPDRVVYSGSNLNRAEMEQLVQWGVTTFNWDSVSQLRLFCEVYGEIRGQEAGGRGQGAELIQNSKFKIQNSELTHPPSLIPHLSSSLRLGLRLNLHQLTGNSRIGIRPEEFPAAISLAQEAGLKLTGLHFYRGTGTNATTAFTRVIDAVVQTAKQLPDWEYLDFGGGFGYPYHHGGPTFDWEQFGSALTRHLQCLSRPIDLIIEPGRAAIAGCATLLCQVVSAKWQNKKQIVGVDSTVANLSVPSVHGGYREIVSWKGDKELGVRGPESGARETQGQEDTQSPVLSPQSSVINFNSNLIPQNLLIPHPSSLIPHPSSPPFFLTDICGNTTYSRDYLGKNSLLPALEVGDILAILDVGAYGYAMSSHFLHRPRPAEVLLEADTHRLIRKREDYSVLLENQVFN